MQTYPQASEKHKENLEKHRQAVAEARKTGAALPRPPTAAQMAKFDPETVAAAKKFVKPFPKTELDREMELFLELFQRPVVQDALRKFVEEKGKMTYLT